MKQSEHYRLTRIAEEKADKAGGGVWFSKEKPVRQIIVEVSFYPKTKLWRMDDGKRVPITKAELDANYQRLAV